jgi:tetratricopeptide (TPR) repeat protein
MDNTTSIRNPWKRVVSEQYDSTEVIGGFEAVTKLKSASYSAVIVNISLAQIKGVDAIAKIREKFPEMPILVIYDPKDVQSLRQSNAYGIKNSFQMPIDPTHLLAALSQCKNNHVVSHTQEEINSAGMEMLGENKSTTKAQLQTDNQKEAKNYVDIEALFYEGLSAIAANHINKAIQIYKDILGLTNIKRETWLRYVEESLFHLGQCYARLKEYDKSNKFYSDFVTRAPHHNCVKEALLYLGRNYEAMNDFEKASNYYKKVITMRPFDSFSTQARKLLSKIGKS